MDLHDIAKAPTPENSAILLDPSDHVAIARVDLAAGARIVVAGAEVRLAADVPAGHKVAIRPVPPGENVRRYGQVIGRATHPIVPGDHVHTHNLAFDEGIRAYEFPGGDSAPPAPAPGAHSFLGYPRPDGRAGTRNYIAVVAASNCAAHTAVQLARHYESRPLPENVDGIVAFPHGTGCGMAIGPDTDLLHRTLTGVVHHPNVSAAILLGLGCEVNQVDGYAGLERLVPFTLQQSGGTRATVEAASAEVDRLIEAASAQTRIPLPASLLCLGLNCGGSDAFSGITANPALGCCSDLLASFGASAVLAETPEIFGAEHLLVRRARNRATAEKLLEMIASYQAYLKPFGASFDDNPSPGNKEGGLSNILEKSLGAVAKGGISRLNEVVDYGCRVHGPGLVFMNTPGYDPVSLAGLAAGGVNLIAFTTGRGSAIGFPTIPVVKIATNSTTFRAMRDNMDVNAGRIADGEAGVAEVGREIFDLLLEVASGRRTAAERNGHKEFVPWQIGPVM
jgi:altronate hydrolase